MTPPVWTAARAGTVAAALRQQPVIDHRASPWQLRWRPVCASTERELERWLRLQPTTAPQRVVLARRQRHGVGQRGRSWLAPAGGVWLSAALPWPADPGGAASLALAVSVGVLLQLHPLLAHRDKGTATWRLGLKWPNDLMLSHGGEGWRKLAGVLPRLRWRGGAVCWAQVGIGLNGCNPVPPGAVALAAALGRLHPELHPSRLAGRVLRGLEWAGAHSRQPEAVCALAERHLVLPQGPIWHEQAWWSPCGLALDGALLLQAEGRRCRLERHF